MDVQYEMDLDVQENCICPTECDCQCPEPDEGVAGISMNCPVHNWNPDPVLECPNSKHKIT